MTHDKFQFEVLIKFFEERTGKLYKPKAAKTGAAR